MALTRKRKREIARLKGRASDLWDDQKDVIERANKVVREASRHAGYFAKEEVAPRVQETFEERIAPAVASGLSAARGVASAGRERVANDVFPAASSAFGSALALLDVAKDPKVREALSRISEGGVKAAGKATKTASKAGAKVGIVKPKSSGPGRYILIGIGVVAVIGVAYAAWQTLRADDDLWIDDEDVAEPGVESLPS